MKRLYTDKQAKIVDTNKSTNPTVVIVKDVRITNDHAKDATSTYRTTSEGVTMQGNKVRIATESNGKERMVNITIL